MSGYWDSFDMQVQCEEVYNPLLMPENVEEGSEDVMNMPILSLDYIRQVGQEIAYTMEEAIIEAEELDWLWDSNEAHEELDRKFRMNYAY